MDVACSSEASLSAPARHTSAKVASLAPAGFAILYPFILAAFHDVVGSAHVALAAWRVAAAGLILAAAFAVPAFGMLWAGRAASTTTACRLAYASVAAPTLYVFLGVVQTMMASPISDEVVWCTGWGGAALWTMLAPARSQEPRPEHLGHWRVAHGIAGAVILLYVAFHLMNHLFGLFGATAHAEVMDVGRKVYRARAIEPLLVLAMLFQTGSGLRLAWRWSASAVGFHRIVQIASGFYLSVFILGHMNSVFFYARSYLGILTDWAFATGAPAGIIHDAWNIRLLPHYALGVFFVLVHLASGARVVAIAHGTSRAAASRVWTAGVILSGVVAVAIIAGMCGVRVNGAAPYDSFLPRAQ